MFEQKQGSDIAAFVAIVDQEGALLHKMAIPLAYQADDGLKQRVPGADKGRDRLLVDPALVEADALILRLNRRTETDLAVALPHG